MSTSKIEAIRARLDAARDTSQGFKNLCMAKDNVGYHAEDDLSYLLDRVERLERVASWAREVVEDGDYDVNFEGKVEAPIQSELLSNLGTALAALDADEKGEE